MLSSSRPLGLSVHLAFPLTALLWACGASDGAPGPARDASIADSAPGASSDGSTPPPTPDGSIHPPADSGVSSADGGGCGYRSEGVTLTMDAGISLCLPPVVCTSETCPPTLGSCVNGRCAFTGGYEGLATLPEAWVTYYCTLSTGGCNGVTQVNPAATTAANVAGSLGLPLCEGADGGDCVGIAASSPMVVGNSQEAKDPVTGSLVAAWGLGLSEASGLCYALVGPGGRAVVALTDRCGGYCKCAGSGFAECGPCVNAPDMVPNCTCVGTDPGLYTNCCGNGCATLESTCDWCASNNHPHFDLDTATFQRVCGPKSSMGSCKLSSAAFIPCPAASVTWPPGGGGASCKSGSFSCSAGNANQPLVPGTSCCCNWGLKPQPDGTCA